MRMVPRTHAHTRARTHACNVFEKASQSKHVTVTHKNYAINVDIM